MSIFKPFNRREFRFDYGHFYIDWSMWSYNKSYYLIPSFVVGLSPYKELYFNISWLRSYASIWIKIYVNT